LQEVREPYLRSEIVRAIATSRSLAEMVCDVAGMHRSGVRLFHDIGLIKSDGARALGYHQDFPFMPFDRKGSCTLWFALDDVPDNSGTLRFVEGSHEWGPLGRHNVVDRDWLSENPHTDATISAPNAMSAGSATLHDTLTLHGTDANESGVARIAYAIVYIPADTLFNGLPCRWVEGLDLRMDEPFDHARFPLLVVPASR
jgi:ectoine hydroxylase-related dioxygenase (phytanoyl-CoA dioxygenase family)